MFGLVPWRKEKGEERGLAPREEGPFGLMRRELDSLFDRMFAGWPAPGDWGLRVEDGDKEHVVRAEAPGFEAGDFDVQVSGDVLHVRAERKADGKDGSGHARLERWVT